MVFIRLSVISAVLALFSALSSAAPADQLEERELVAPDNLEERELVARDNQTEPHWVIYSDKWATTPPPATAIKGYNVFALSFLLTTGPADNALSWSTLSEADRTAVKTQYAAAGIKLIVSAFGATDTPASAGADAATAATTMGNWVKQYNLDGIDVDFEDFNAMGSGKAEAWLATFTQTLRGILPQGQYILTHAPLAPWFTPTMYSGGGYLKIHQTVGNLIDWYNIQYYNQGVSEYTTCDNLLKASSAAWPKTAVLEIAANGVDLNKLVIGKPAGQSDASNGFMDAATLATCVAQAKASNWNAGAMVWQYPDADASWVATVRGQAFPI